MFLSSHSRYLEHELYIMLSKALQKDFDTIYFESDFESKITYKYSEPEDKRKKQKAFNQYLRLPNFINLFDIVKKQPDTSILHRKLNNYKKLLDWRNQFINILKSNTPDAIVYISQKEVNYKISWMFFPDIPKIYIQPANIAKSTKRKKNWSTRIKRFLFNRVFKLPFYAKSSLNLNEDDSTHYLLWASKYLNHLKIKPNRRNYFVGSPNYDKLLRNFKQVKPIPELPNIVIYLNKKRHIGLENWEKYVTLYEDVRISNAKFNFIYKIHPLDDFEIARKRLADAVVSQDTNLLDQADVVLTHWSTMCYESICKGIPTILVNPNGEFDFSEFQLESYPAIIENSKEFNFWLDQFKNPKAKVFDVIRKDFVKEQLSYDDGKSLERTVRTIQNILTDQNQKIN